MKEMIFEIDKDIWFDADKLFVINGRDHYESYKRGRENYPYPEKHSKKQGFPSIVFLSSVSCNLKCQYCYAGQGSYNKVSSKVSFEFEDYVEAYDQIAKEYGGVDRIGFFGGEPLLNFKTIKRFVEYLYDHVEPSSLTNKIGINSNGTIINKEIKDFLLRYSITFGTSLDGPKVFNDVCRFGDSVTSVYDTVINTIKYLGNEGVSTALQFTLSRPHVENYQPGDIAKWVSVLESLPLAYYEIIPVTTEDPACKIDLRDEKIKENFALLCTELADHCLASFISGETAIMPGFCHSIFLSIAKRKIAGQCGAGKSMITISPDLRVYPCHVNASTRENSVPCDNRLRQHILNNLEFGFMRNTNREGVQVCNQCIAKKVCHVFCKGLCSREPVKPPYERCFMMEIFIKRVVLFMIKKYPQHKDRIKESIININKRHKI